MQLSTMMTSNLVQQQLTRSTFEEDVNSEIEFSSLEDISDPLQRLSMVLDIRDILNDMVWFYNEFPEQRKTAKLDTDDEISNGEREEKKTTLSEIEAMKNLLEVISPSLRYILSSLSHTRRNIALTGVSPILFHRSVELIMTLEATENLPLEIVQEINRRLSEVNEELFSIEGYLAPLGSMDQETNGGNISQNEMEHLRKAFIDDKPLWNIKDTIQTENISFLLFNDEKIRMKAILDKGIDPRLHLKSIAEPLVYVSKKEEEATFNAIKAGELLPIALKAINYYKKDDESAIKCSIITNLISEERKSQIIAFLPLLDIVFFAGNVVIDIITGTEYIWQKEYVLGSLTIFCLLLPILAEIVSKLILKMLGWGKKFGGVRWQDIPPYEYFNSFSRMAKHFTYTYRAYTNYNGLENIYSKLHYYRCIKGHQRFEKYTLREDSTKIQHLCLALSHCNQLLINQWQLAERLWEDVPQLLIQMVAFVNLKGKIWTYLTLGKSLLRFSFTMKSAHENIHKSSVATIWKNDFSVEAIITEVLGYLLIFGTRFFCISVFLAIIPVWFTLIAAIYLVFLYVILTFVSKRSNHYRKLHGYKTTAFWPLARLYTIPHTVGVWRFDSLDHALFYLETVSMAAFIPNIFPNDTVTGIFIIQSSSFEWIVLSCAFLSAIILIIFKYCFHKTNHLCEKVNQIAPPSDPNKVYNDVQDFI